MSKKSPKQLLHLITSNTQHLTNIIHLNQSSKLTQYKKIQSQTICPISICKTVVQITYLYYTCALYCSNVYVSYQPLFIRRFGRSLCETVLVFYLEVQEEIQTSTSIVQNIREEFKEYCNFTLFQASKFNTTIIPFLNHLLTSTTFTPQKVTQYPSVPKLLLANFLKQVRKNIQPNLLNNSQYPVIKHLQKTKLFLNYCDILLIYKTSIYYRIKKDQKFIECMANSKMNFKKNINYFNQSKNWMMAYKILDKFLLELTSYEILLLEKSSTKESVLTNHYAVGVLLKYVENGKQRQKYQAKFYTIFSNLDYQQETTKSQQQQQKEQKNMYTLTYSIQKLIMQVKYITKLEASQQKMDAICFHCSNVSFKNARISVQPFDFLHTTLGNIQTRKFLAFKVEYKMEKIDEPFSVALMLIQHVTICTKVFLELVVKKPEKDPTQLIAQYSRRLEHLLRIFIQKSLYFYQNL